MAAAYLPFGPQLNVAISTVTSGGWNFCYAANMGSIFGTSAASVLSGCSGNRILLGALPVSDTNTFAVLAQTTMAKAFQNTGAADNGIFTTADGSDWFNADNWSWGFKPVGVPFQKFQCAFAPPTGSMCIHTLDYVGGYSVNTDTGSAAANGYYKIVFSGYFEDNSVPEPASWAMLIAGFGLTGAVMRRRRALTA